MSALRAGPYCAAHGGKARALREAHADWDYTAPSSVGNHESVLDAGSYGLTSRDAYVVVRLLPEEVRPALWRVRMAYEQRETILARSLERGAASIEPTRKILRALGLGCGTLMTPDERRARGCADYVIDISSHASRDSALDAGRAAWRARIDADVQRIRDARGGTLEWGVPVEALPDPILLDPAPRESAWSAVARTPRRAAQGLSLLSGVRASGEPA